MMQPNLIPVLDPNPLPAPYWVFKLLLIVTFFLHILAMNFMLGGGGAGAGGEVALQEPRDGKRMFFDVAKKLPVLLAGNHHPRHCSAALRAGALRAVLLHFVHHHGLAVVPGAGAVSPSPTTASITFHFAAGRSPGKAGSVMLLSTILVFLIGFAFSNNLTLSQTPSRWGAKYFANPAGWNLNLSEPTLIPRFLHFLVAAVAVGGLLLVFMALANWKRDNEYARQLLQFGGKAFMYATMAQIVVGIVFLVSLPRDMRMLFMGDNPLATTLLLVGVTGAHRQRFF